MHEHHRKQIEQKFKTENPLNDLTELLHISHNLNLAIDKYFDEFGGQRRQSVRYWNNRMTEFLNKRKVNNDTLEK